MKATAKQRKLINHRRKLSNAREPELLKLRNAVIPGDHETFTDAIVIYEVVTETGKIIHRTTSQHSALVHSLSYSSMDWFNEPEMRAIVRLRLGSLLPLRVNGGEA